MSKTIESTRSAAFRQLSRHKKSREIDEQANLIKLGAAAQLQHKRLDSDLGDESSEPAGSEDQCPIPVTSNAQDIDVKTVRI